MKQNHKALIANEIKRIFIFIIIGVTIGLISLPILYTKVYEVNKYDEGGFPYSHELPPDRSWTAVQDWAYSKKDLINIYKNYQTKRSLITSGYIILISSSILIVGHYLFKGYKWVDNNSTI